MYVDVAIQAGPAGGAGLWLLLIAYLSIPILVGYWVYRDASNRGSAKALNWALAVFAFGLMSPIPLAVAIALYLSVRGEFGGPDVDTDG
jgi:hypothetical protein